MEYSDSLIFDGEKGLLCIHTDMGYSQMKVIPKIIRFFALPFVIAEHTIIVVLNSTNL